MAITIFLILFIAMAALAPWLGTDSRGLTERYGRPDTYPAMPSTRDPRVS